MFNLKALFAVLPLIGSVAAWPVNPSHGTAGVVPTTTVPAASLFPVPTGGVGARANDTPPVYGVMSEFDYQSFVVGLNQEWIELDLFNYGVARFSEQEFADAGITPDDISLIQFIADQEVGHAELITNIIDIGGYGPAPLQCKYKYDFNSVREFVNFCQQLTRWGESGVYGFLQHLDSRPAAQLLLQSITTEARQQMIFRQFSGAQPMPVYFETGISQAMSWSLLSRYIVECPAQNPHIVFPIFPSLTVKNGASLLVDGYNAAITHNRTSLTYAGQTVEFEWEAPGKTVSYNNSYNTSISPYLMDSNAKPSYVAWINELNVTYTPLNMTSEYCGSTYQPAGKVYEDLPETNSLINGTMFAAIVSEDVYVTPYNLSLLNDYIFAWGLYQAD